MDVRDLIGRKRAPEEAFDAVPPGWICSGEAARMLNVPVRSARRLLTRFKVRYVLVKGQDNAKFWAWSDVRALVKVRKVELSTKGARPGGCR